MSQSELHRIDQKKSTGDIKMFIEPKDLLFEERLAPITTSFGLIEKPYIEVANCFLDWRETIKKGNKSIIKNRKKVVNGNLEDILRSLLPLNLAGLTKFLFIPTINGWTTYFDNCYRGTDSSAISYLSKLLSCHSISVFTRPNTSQRPGNLVMDYFGAEETKWRNLIRGIRLENDRGRWNFEQLGEPLPFEHIEHYSLKNKTDRFNLSLLNEYLVSIGNLTPFMEDFYLTTGDSYSILVEIDVRWKNANLG